MPDFSVELAYGGGRGYKRVVVRAGNEEEAEEQAEAMCGGQAADVYECVNPVGDDGEEI